MRTETKWDEIKWNYLNKFPLRIQQDLRKFENKNVPAIEDSVFIYGDVNTGKTVLAAQMMMKELKTIYLKAIPGQHNKTVFVSFPDMLAQIKNTFGNGESTEIVMRTYLEAHLLVLDDFVTVRPSDWVVETLYHLINYRYENMKKTIITCNFSLDELEGMLQEQRITSRIGRSYLIIKKQSYK